MYLTSAVLALPLWFSTGSLPAARVSKLPVINDRVRTESLSAFCVFKMSWFIKMVFACYRNEWMNGLTEFFYGDVFDITTVDIDLECLHGLAFFIIPDDKDESAPVGPWQPELLIKILFGVD